MNSELSGTEQAFASQFLGTAHGWALSGLVLEAQPLRGGLESPSVQRVTARFRDPLGRPRVVRYISKRLDGAAAREAAVYEWLRTQPPGLAPRVLAVDLSSPEGSVIYLEPVRRVAAWPWRDVKVARSLLSQLARFHELSRAHASSLPEWNYEAELLASAQSTLEALELLRRDPELASLASGLRRTRRLVLSLPKLRAQLLRFAPPASGPIHGDVHPGNALVRRRAGSAEAVLIDWGRARLGSPLEDVSSWLQSLGFWEPEARRRHDTLLTAYLSARGLEQKLSTDLRAAYWLAGASNALAGALRYHLSVAAAAPNARRRAAALSAAQDWLRVIRRADAHYAG